MKTLLSALAMAAVIASGSAFAAEKPAAKETATQAETVKVKKDHKKKEHHKKEHKKADPAAKAAKKEKSKKCSADADAQKLHGKARKEFRKNCLKAA